MNKVRLTKPNSRKAEEVIKEIPEENFQLLHQNISPLQYLLPEQSKQNKSLGHGEEYDKMTRLQDLSTSPWDLLP